LPATFADNSIQVWFRASLSITDTYEKLLLHLVVFYALSECSGSLPLEAMVLVLKAGVNSWTNLLVSCGGGAVPDGNNTPHPISGPHNSPGAPGKCLQAQCSFHFHFALPLLRKVSHEIIKPKILVGLGII
jgi:hypothetical protein